MNHLSLLYTVESIPTLDLEQKAIPMASSISTLCGHPSYVDDKLINLAATAKLECCTSTLPDA